MRPASRPFCSCSDPSVAEICSSLCTSNVSGSEPKLSWLARLAADSRVNVPEISALPSAMITPVSRLGAEITRPSSTIANWFCGGERREALQPRGHVGELRRALAVERDVDDPLVALTAAGQLVQARGRAGDPRALDLDRTEDVLRAAVLVARDEGLVRVAVDAAGEVGRVGAVEGVELGLDRRGDVVRDVAGAVGRRLGGLVRRLLRRGAWASGSAPARPGPSRPRTRWAPGSAVGVRRRRVADGQHRAGTPSAPTSGRARASPRSGCPGSATTMLLPLWLVISASATPEESTRWRITSIAWAIVSTVTSSPFSATGVRMICVPPSRSSARFGVHDASDHLVPAAMVPKSAKMRMPSTTSVRTGL